MGELVKVFSFSMRFLMSPAFFMRFGNFGRLLKFGMPIWGTRYVHRYCIVCFKSDATWKIDFYRKRKNYFNKAVNINFALISMRIMKYLLEEYLGFLDKKTTPFKIPRTFSTNLTVKSYKKDPP